MTSRYVDVEYVRIEDVEVGDIVSDSRSDGGIFYWHEVEEVRQALEFGDTVVLVVAKTHPQQVSRGTLIGQPLHLIAVQVMRGG